MVFHPKNRIRIVKMANFYMMFASRCCTQIYAEQHDNYVENFDSPEEKNESPDRIADGNYDASKLSQLKDLKPCARSRACISAGTDERALHHCVSEVLDNSVDEHLAGIATTLR